MKPSLILIMVLLTTCGALPQADLRPQLEKAFEAHQSAIVARDAEMFKRTLASYRYRKLRNQAVYRGEKFPEPFFEEYVKYNLINLKELQHVETVARGGDVTYMAYFGKEPASDASKLRPVLTYMLFVKEAGQWKLAEVEQGNLSPEEAGIAPSQLVKKYPPQFQESEGALAGKVPALPPEYPQPDYLGGIHASAENCEVTLKYNAEVDSIEDSSMSEPMKGGLRRGKNSIQIIVRPPAQAPSAKPRVVVDVWVYSDRATPVTKVFHFETESLGVFDKEFEVTDDSLNNSRDK